MSERGLPIVDGAPACPFVAFDDDRDARATSPDHRHRCYAEVRPAPRAIAHQEAYCLANAFPVCPTFQDWAKREAAKAQPPRQAAGQPEPDDVQPAPEGPRPGTEEPKRNPRREWSAPPPWSGGVPASADLNDDDDATPPGFLVGRSQPGSRPGGAAPDQSAGSVGVPADIPARRPERDTLDPRRVDAQQQGEGRPRVPRDKEIDADDGSDDGASYDKEGGHGSNREAGRAAGTGALLPGFGDRRPRVSQTRPRNSDTHTRGPSWEQPRRSDSYPVIRTRLSMPSMPQVPRLGVMAAALVVAALALFFLPALLGVGGPDGGLSGASPTPTTAPAATSTPDPTALPAPTPQVYVVQSGDTMSRIANRFGVSLDALIEANRETIPNPDRLNIGDQLVIPASAGSRIPTPAPESPQP